jgi:hypothetical protein
LAITLATVQGYAESAITNLDPAATDYAAAYAYLLQAEAALAVLPSSDSGSTRIEHAREMLNNLRERIRMEKDAAAQSRQPGIMQPIEFT